MKVALLFQKVSSSDGNIPCIANRLLAVLTVSESADQEHINRAEEKASVIVQWVAVFAVGLIPIMVALFVPEGVRY